MMITFNPGSVPKAYLSSKYAMYYQGDIEHESEEVHQQQQLGNHLVSQQR
jgi:hypothetical protein